MLTELEEMLDGLSYVLVVLKDVGFGTKVADGLVMNPVERHLVFVLPVEPAGMVLVPLPKP